jgi:ATP-binding cassette subfamily B protein RaxB
VQALDIDFFRRTRVPLILQSEAAECGLACVAMLAGFYRHNVSLSELRRRKPVSLKGLALSGLVDAARAIGLDARPLRLECNELRRLRMPCVLHWRMNHFVVLERVGPSTVQIADPAIGRRRIPLGQCAESFTGIALELFPGAEFHRKKPVSRVTLMDLLRGIRGIVSPLA